MKNLHEKNCSRKSAIVIGGGLVGTLCVCILAERGYDVKMYEKREDIRKTEVQKGRSINLALSHRGRKALRLIGVENEVLKSAVPMYGRLLHLENGKIQSLAYDPISDECIYSVGRNFLNCVLLNVADKCPNVELYFNNKLMNVDFNENFVTLESSVTKDTLKTTADFIVGADGSFSSLRSFFQKTPLFDFSQNFIDHGYLELSVPSDRGSKLVSNHLHIWPRGEFMMIALPNQDSSWTMTLFMPFETFEAIDSGDKLLSFFKKKFPDALPLIGEKELETTYFQTPPFPLVSIKCGRYDMGDRFLIIGDAAHAMVPFYGQGMNAGFEDCTLLNKILNETKDDISKTIKLFTNRRRKDVYTICDLAMYNYTEMRDLVTKPTFRLRKTVDKYLGKIFPKKWIPLYSSVSFSHMNYSWCLENWMWQNKVLHYAFFVAAFIILLISLIIATTL